jgi:hypothetical protein
VLFRINSVSATSITPAHHTPDFDWLGSLPPVGVIEVKSIMLDISSNTAVALEVNTGVSPCHPIGWVSQVRFGRNAKEGMQSHLHWCFCGAPVDKEQGATHGPCQIACATARLTLWPKNIAHVLDSDQSALYCGTDPLSVPLAMVTRSREIEPRTYGDTLSGF